MLCRQLSIDRLTFAKRPVRNLPRPRLSKGSLKFAAHATRFHCASGWNPTRHATEFHCAPYRAISDKKPVCTSKTKPRTFTLSFLTHLWPASFVS